MIIGFPEALPLPLNPLKAELFVQVPHREHYLHRLEHVLLICLVYARDHWHVLHLSLYDLVLFARGPDDKTPEHVLHVRIGQVIIVRKPRGPAISVQYVSVGYAGRDRVMKDYALVVIVIRAQLLKRLP